MADGLDLAFAATLEPARAVAYLRGKGIGVSWDWHDTWEAAHARAFVVAKAAKLDVLSTLREAVDAALAKGQTRRRFVRELEPRLRALGWWGRRVVAGPDGEDGEVQLGSPRRLKTIYDTNMRTAYAASRFRAQHANAASRPYFQYLSMSDDRVRPSHRAMSGRVYRHDDPIWDTHYPPNGFNCRCTVRAHGLGVYRTGTADGGVLRPTEQVVGVDRRTGRRRRQHLVSLARCRVAEPGPPVCRAHPQPERAPARSGRWPASLRRVRARVRSCRLFRALLRRFFRAPLV